MKERTLLWIVSVQEYSQPNLLGEADELYEVVIRVQPGLWTYNSRLEISAEEIQLESMDVIYA